MAPFQFSFDIPSGDQQSNVQEKPKNNKQGFASMREETSLTETCTKKESEKSLPLVFIENTTSMLQILSTGHIDYDFVSLIDGDSSSQGGVSSTVNPLLRIRASSVKRRANHDMKQSEKNSEKDICQELERQQTDIIPGVYEGGLKVWECSVDLCKYLVKHYIQFTENDQSQSTIVEHAEFNIADALLQGGYILELGCGQGLPGCLLLREILLCRQKLEQSQPKHPPLPPFSVLFNDYNEFVLRDVTLPNVLLNTTKSFPHLPIPTVSKHLILAGGDWLELAKQMQTKSKSPNQTEQDEGPLPPNGRFNLILAAETTYTTKSAEDTAILMARHLVPETGIGLVATKRYYFGVGGGTSAFKQACVSTSDSIEPPNIYHLLVKTLEVYDSGTGNIRELLGVKLVTK